MGTFGYGGFDNDTAFDFLDGIYKKITIALNKPIVCRGGQDQDGIEYRRAASELIIRLSNTGLHVYEETLDLAIDRLEEIADCDFSDWRDPKQAQQALFRQIRELAAIRNRARRSK